MDRWLARLISALERLSRGGVYVGCAMLLLAAGLVTFEVVARKLFHFSLSGADEIAGYAFAISIAWGYSFALFQRAHIRVDALYVRLPERAQRVLDVVALAGFSIVIGLVGYRALMTLMETLRLEARSSTPLSVPLWIPQSLWLLGLSYFLLCIVALFLRASLALAQGRHETVKQVAGAPSVIGARTEDVPASRSAR